jgi:hypothetical protein
VSGELEGNGSGFIAYAGLSTDWNNLPDRPLPCVFRKANHASQQAEIFDDY